MIPLPSIENVPYGNWLMVNEWFNAPAALASGYSRSCGSACQLPPSIPDIKAAEKSVQPDGRAWDSSVAERPLKGLWSGSRTRCTTQRKLLNHAAPMNRLPAGAGTMGYIVASLSHHPLFHLNHIYWFPHLWFDVWFMNQKVYLSFLNINRNGKFFTCSSCHFSKH